MNNIDTKTLPSFFQTILPAIKFVLVALLVSLLFSMASGNLAHAGKTEDEAKKYCDSLDLSSSKLKTACKAGFKKGYNKLSKETNVCHKLNTNEKSEEYKTCAAAYRAGKAAKEAGSGSTADQFAGKEKCGNVATFFDYSCGSVDNKSGGSSNPIFKILLTVIAWLTAGVMVAVVGGIVYGGFLYLTAQDNAGQTQKGIIVIVDAVIGLIAFSLMWALLNFIIPGGIYN